MSLSVNIRKKLPAFDLDVQIEAGEERLGLLGASGCGKSLTMRCIAGVETPDEGRIVVNDRVFFDSEAKVNLTPQERKTAYLFQNYQLFPNLSVEQNVQAGMDRTLTKAQKHEAALKALGVFSMEGFAQRYPGRLSGGQQQRVALARMIAARPGIFMFDEPFSALDAYLKSSLEQTLLDMLDLVRSTVLYVSHDIDEAFRFCDRICVIADGRVAEIGPTSQIVNDPHTLAAVKLSGCKNVSPAVKVDDHTVEATDWGMAFHTRRTVPDDVAHVGIRASYIHRPKADKVEGHNTFELTVHRTSDSRFERSVMLETPAGDKLIQWKADKLLVPADELPVAGDRLLLHFDAEKLYLVSE